MLWDTPENDVLNLAKVGVEGSNPFARSNRKPQKTAVFSGFFVSAAEPQMHEATRTEREFASISGTNLTHHRTPVLVSSVTRMPGWKPRMDRPLPTSRGPECHGRPLALRRWR